MTIDECIRTICQEKLLLSETPRLDCEVLIAHVLSRDRTYVLSHQEAVVPEVKIRKFKNLVRKRAGGCPVAYLTNKKEFYGLPFYVDERVLIPRPETEQLVDFAYNGIAANIESQKLESMSIIDVGCGSGCIAISLMHKIRETDLHTKCRFSVYLSDVSGKALQVAKRNYKVIIGSVPGIEVHFVKSDLLYGFSNRFDVIVSNPPYIPEEDIERLDVGVREFEPYVALSGGEGGIQILKRLISQSTERLNPGGVVWLEIHEDHPSRIGLFVQEEYPDWDVRFVKDVFGEWRFCRMVQPNTSY